MTNLRTSLPQSIDALKLALNDREEEVKCLEAAKLSASKAASVLNKKIADQGCMFEIEKKSVISEYKKEVKSWRKELGEANKQHIKLKKKMDILQNLDNDYFEPSSEIITQAEFDRVQHTRKDSATFCTICAVRIDNFMPEYFLGEQINPACKDCLRAANILIGDEVSDPFSSFSDGMPTSLSAHWIPPYMGISSPCISYLSSFRAHYVLLPNPGSRFISMEEVMREFKLMMEELQRDMLEKWKQM